MPQRRSPVSAHDAHAPHVTPYGRLFGVLAALLALTALTILLSKVDVGGLNIWLTLLVASCKSSLVLMYFMHLRYELRVFTATFLITVFTVAAFVGLLFWDVAYRTAVH
jgi:cytochrome c oxidase subunit 4